MVKRGSTTCLAVITAVALVCLMSGCGRAHSALPGPPIVVQLPDVAPDVWASRGHVVERHPMLPPLDDRDDPVVGESWRAVYTSVSGTDGGVRQVAGTFFTPSGVPPQDGWPVVSLAHGTTGIANGCGPSTDPNLRGYWPDIRMFLAQGYAVAFTDYEGLGGTGLHPYLEPRTEAFNITDAVRALREISPAVSPRWAAYGASQGGQAAWAADELNAFYGDGLELVGSVAVSPAANVSGLVDLASSGAMTRDQQEYYPMVIAGLERYNAELSGLLHRRTADYDNAFADCGAYVPPESLRGIPLLPRRFIPRTLEDRNRLRGALRGIALPQRPLDRPMLVVNTMQDKIVLPEWVEDATIRSCDLGGQIEYVEVPHADHAELTEDVTRMVITWIADRFAGAPAASKCPVPR